MPLLFKRSKRAPDRVFDIGPAHPLRAEVINLKPSFLVRYQRWFMAGFAVIALTTFLFTQVFLQASAAYFYPQSCLGTWDHVDRAEGKPQATTADEIVPSTAARFDASSQDIYCGGFTGAIPEGSAVTRMQLRFFWNVTSEKLREHPVITAPTERSDTRDGSSSSDTPVLPNTVLDIPGGGEVEFEITQVNPGDTVPSSPDSAPDPASDTSTPSPEPAPTPDVTPTESSPSDTTPVSDTAPTSYWSVPLVYAQEAPVSEPAPTPDATPTESTPSDTTPVSNTTDTTMASTTSPDVSTTTSVVMPMPLDAGNNFLAIQYTLDGATWQMLKEVNEGNWQEPVELPMTMWEDVARLQVKVSRIPTLDDAPYVYLDGIELAAEYSDAGGMVMPDFDNDQPIAIKSNERYVIIDTLRHSDRRRLLWLYERGEYPQWRVIADDESMASSSPLALRGAHIFWLSRDMRAIAGFDAETSTYFSKTLDRRDPTGYSIPYDERTTVTFSETGFSFFDIERGITLPSDDDVSFSTGFWEYASVRARGVATSTTSTVDLASSTMASTTVTSTSPDEIIRVIPPDVIVSSTTPDTVVAP